MAKILVIDDHPELRELFGEVLTIAGHEVLTAADGSLGLALYARHRPVLVITDMEVSGISGLEVIDRLRGEPGVKVIAISGSGRANLLAARAVGAAMTLEKPFSVDQLLAAVGQLVDEPPPA